jgi:hypothetical protein
MGENRTIWVFNGVQSPFPSGVFTTRKLAESWIRDRDLTGTLTEYSLDVGMYEYAISKGIFSPKKDEHMTALFIGKFTDGGVDHLHYEDGALGHA